VHNPGNYAEFESFDKLGTEQHAKQKPRVHLLTYTITVNSYSKHL